MHVYDISAGADLHVCGDCGAIVGEVEGRRSDRYWQLGSCQQHPDPPYAEPWPGLDYNLRVQLCQCCGRIPLWSGSRWSVWFCRACCDEVRLMNARYGRCVVSPGRHSVHAHVALPAGAVRRPGAVQGFFDTMMAVWGTSRVLRRWGREAVRLNLEATGRPRSSIVQAATYLDEVADAVSADDRFRQVCAFLAAEGRFPEVAGESGP